MCGPTAQEESLAGGTQSMAQTLSANYNTLFAGQADVLSKLNASLSPIISAGPNQQGFSAPELAAMNTSAINQNAAAYQNAARSARAFSAGQGGGGSTGLTSGVAQQIQGSIAATTGANTANELNQITQANYATGRQNYFQALGGTETLAGLYNPNATANAFTGASSAGFQQAATIQQQQNAEAQDIVGGFTALAGSAMDMYGNVNKGQGF